MVLRRRLCWFVPLYSQMLKCPEKKTPFSFLPPPFLLCLLFFISRFLLLLSETLLCFQGSVQVVTFRPETQE